MRKSWFELLTSSLILIAIVVLLDMLLTTARAEMVAAKQPVFTRQAVDCVQAPPKHHQKHVPPVACTVAPPLPAILRPEPDELAPIAIYVHYQLIGMCFEEIPLIGMPIEAPPHPNVPEPPGWLMPIGVGGGYILIWGVPTTTPAPLPVVAPPRTLVPYIPRSTPTKAPEISSDGMVGALTLLAGIMAVLRGRHDFTSGRAKMSQQ